MSARRPRRDARYSVRLEFCGHIRAQYVVRFCGVWLGCAPDRAGAAKIRDDHQARRAADMAALATLPPLNFSRAIG